MDSLQLNGAAGIHAGYAIATSDALWDHDRADADVVLPDLVYRDGGEVFRCGLADLGNGRRDLGGAGGVAIGELAQA